jgi:hypothetical protein
MKNPGYRRLNGMSVDFDSMFDEFPPVERPGAGVIGSEQFTPIDYQDCSLEVIGWIRVVQPVECSMPWVVQRRKSIKASIREGEAPAEPSPWATFSAQSGSAGASPSLHGASADARSLLI